MIFYNNNFFFHYLLLRTLFISKFNIGNIYQIPVFKSIKCGIKLVNLKSLTDPKILQSLEILEMISGKKPKITKISSGYFKSIETSVKLESVIKQEVLWNFLTYYNYFLKPISVSKKIRLEGSFLGDKIFVFVEDISLFSHLEEKFIKDKMPIFLEIKFGSEVNKNLSFKEQKKIINFFF